MAGGWSLAQQHANVVNLSGVGSDTRGINLHCTTPNTPGAWTQLNASCPIDVVCLIAFVNTFTSASINAAVDIGVGSAASEKIVVQSLLCSGFGPNFTESYILPVAIPKGSRIAGRVQDTAGGDDIQIVLTGMDSGWQSPAGYSAIDAVGFNAGATTGLVYDPGGTTMTKGGWAQIASSSANDYAGFFLVFDVNNVSSFVTNNGWAGMSVDVGVGASGSENIIVPDIPAMHAVDGTSSNQIHPAVTEIYWLPIQKGSRIAVRAMCNVATSPDRVMGITLYGIRA